MRREGSRYPLFVQRIPADVREKAVGSPLAIPLGDGFVFVTPSGIARAIRFSLRTADPSEIKTRQAVAAAFLEGVWAALRNDAPTKLSHKQATALAGELYLLGAHRINEIKKGPDRGIDGELFFPNGPGRSYGRLIISVKAGSTGPAHVRELRGVVERENAQMGLFVCLDRPTPSMLREAAAASFADIVHGRISPLLRWMCSPR